MNIKEYKVSKILFIRGVFIKDCIPIDEIFEQQLIEQLDMENPVIDYDKIPSTFTDTKTWVQKTNVKCWYCDLNFDNMPVFIPKIIENAGFKKKYNISTFGCFCSFCCAMSFNNLHNQNICLNVKVKEMLLFLYKIFNGCVINDILVSPNKYQMKAYGGDTESMVYRGKINKLKTQMMEIATPSV